MADLNWDRSFALEQAGEDEEILAELIDLFKQSSNSDLEKIKAAAGVQDASAMGDAAHSIKGAAASLGVESVREVAQAIEKAGRNGDLQNAMQQVPALEDLLAD